MTVVATDSGGNTGTRDAEVNVTNVDEDPSLILSNLQPEEGRAITATLSDPDTPITSIHWVWIIGTESQTSSSTRLSASYIPVSDDNRKNLAAEVTYTDGFGNVKTERVTSGNPVAERDNGNRPPEFDARTTERSIAENTAAGEVVGDEVTGRRWRQ